MADVVPKGDSMAINKARETGSTGTNHSTTADAANTLGAKNHPLEPVLAFADRALRELSKNDEAQQAASNGTIILPFELTPKERVTVHQYIQSQNGYSKTVKVKGSNLCKVGVCLRETTNNVNVINEQVIGRFMNYTKIPIPIDSPDLIGYYIKAFDASHNAQHLWNLYCEELKLFDMASEMATTTEGIKTLVQSNREYRAVMARKVAGVNNIVGGDVYNFSGVGKHFLSIDIRKGNFTILRRECPSLFRRSNDADSNNTDERDAMDWTTFVGQFTDSKFVAQSKTFREITFGKIGFAKRAKLLQEALMDQVHKLVTVFMTKLEQNQFDMDPTSILIPRVKSGDEIVYEITDSAKFNKLFASMKQTLNEEFGPILHFRAFTLTGIEAKPYFVKTFTYNTDWYDDKGKRIPNENLPFSARIEFKNVPKKYALQVLKWYNKEEIKEEDLYFLDDGVLCKFCHSIFD